MRTVKLTVEYDGSALCGWQRQANGPTVQQHLEEALSAMLGEATQVAGASRTDAGVHATGQVASFRTAARIPPHGFRRGLNGLLPASVAIVDASDEADGFHARFSARGKRYRYTISTRRDRPPLRAGRVWHRPGALDVPAMRRAAAHLIGEHDFSAFRTAGCDAAHAIRALVAIAIEPRGDEVEIEVRGNAFLRNMVRILAGTLFEVGAGRRDADGIPALLAGRDRTAAGVTAPPDGLCLEVVYYAGIDEAGNAYPPRPRPPG